MDHFARDPYEFAYFYMSPLTLNQMHFLAMEKMQSVLNFTINQYNADSDGDKFINNMEVAAIQGADGFVIEPYADIAWRIYETAEELGVPYTCTVNAIYNEQGQNVVPVVVLDQYKNGQTQVNWISEHYKDYWGEIDTSKIAAMFLKFTSNADLVTRSQGAIDRFKELYPNNTVFENDLVSRGFGMEYAYDEAAAMFSAHPEVEYWWVFGVVEDFGQGSSRAVEALGKEDSVLIVTSGANVLPLEWDAGYDGVWVTSYAVYNYNYTVPALCGLIALVDGRAPPRPCGPMSERKATSAPASSPATRWSPRTTTSRWRPTSPPPSASRSDGALRAFPFPGGARCAR